MLLLKPYTAIFRVKNDGARTEASPQPAAGLLLRRSFFMAIMTL